MEPEKVTLPAGEVVHYHGLPFRLSVDTVVWGREANLVLAEGHSCCGHASDCAVHNEPAFPAGPCDCGAQLAKCDAVKAA